MKLHIEQKHMNIINEILEDYDVSFFAFGSRVTGKNKPFSDLDIFYFEALSNREILRLEEAFEESDLPFTVDVVNFKNCDQEFQKVILQNYLCIKRSVRLKTIEQNQLDHFLYLSDNLGFDVHEMNDTTIMNCGLEKNMVNTKKQTP